MNLKSKCITLKKIDELYIISQKGDNIKYLQAFWNKEKRLWVAEGYFDPQNHSYVPGGLNVCVFETEPVTFDYSKGIIDTKDDWIFEAIYKDTSIDQSEWSNKIEDVPESTLPKEVIENSKGEVVCKTDDASIADIHLSNGEKSEDFFMYTDTSDSIYVDGKLVTAEQIEKKPEAYGFYDSGVSCVEKDGKSYRYYVRTPSSSDLKSQVYYKFNFIDLKDKDNTSSGNTGSGNIIDTEKMGSWDDAVGSQIIKLPTQKLSNEGSGSNTDSGNNTGSGSYEAPRQFYTTGMDLTISETSTFLEGTGNKFENVDNKLLSQKYKQMKVSGKILGVAGNIFSIAQYSYEAYNRMQQVNNSDLENKDLYRWSILGLSMFGFGSLIITNVLLAALSLPLLPTMIIAGVLCVAGGKIYDHFAKKLDDRLESDIAKTNKENGYIKFLIDPSGYVYEAVDGNRIEGAKMTIYYKDPKTGKQVEWVAEDYDQINPLMTDTNGQYAWDVPEGLWRVKFEKEGYETTYSDWMNVPPVQTGVNFSVKSIEAPKIIDAAIVDGAINITLSKYMNVKTISTKSVSIMDGNKKVDFKIDPVFTNDGDVYADKFIITPVSGKFSSENLKVLFNNTCKSYSGISLKEQTVQVTVPKNIISITAEGVSIIAAQNQAREISITAKPASVAVDKKLIVKSSSEDVIISEAAFDKNGVAVISVNSSFTGIEQLTFSVEGFDLTAEVTLITVTQEEYETMNSNYVQGDVNGDNKISVADVVLLQKYLVKKVEFTDAQWKLADLNSDGKVNVFDVIILKRKLLK